MERVKKLTIAPPPASVPLDTSHLKNCYCKRATHVVQSDKLRRHPELVYLMANNPLPQSLPRGREVKKLASHFTLHPSLKHKAAFTLAEGATHVAHSNNTRRAAFTLAEVLITLGIIGVVAALTIPSIVADYRNKQTATKLKHAYSVVSQALTAAQVQNGDVFGWDFGYNYGADTSTVNSKEVTINFVEKYFKPNVKIADDIGYYYSATIGYDGIYLPVSKEKQGLTGYWLTLGNGTLLHIGLGDVCSKRDDDGKCIERAYRNILFIVDTNGFKGPNTLGKDVFYITLELTSNKFTMHNYGNSSRNSYLRYCSGNSDAQVCGYLIMLDGWEIKEDYPWKY